MRKLSFNGSTQFNAPQDATKSDGGVTTTDANAQADAQPGASAPSAMWRLDDGMPEISAGRVHQLQEAVMKIKDQETWERGVANNQDFYGAGVYRYAEKWANAMEDRMNGDPEKIKDIARQASHDADEEGITGFMYGCAVEILSKLWEYGEYLRRWHNINIQIGSEGERANESGGVLNPAILTITPKK